MSFTVCLLQAVSFLIGSGTPLLILQYLNLQDLLAIGLIIPLVPSHVRKMGGNHIDVGLLGSIYAGFQLGSGPLMGSLSDLKGRKTILVMTLLVCSIAYVLTGLTSSIYVILFIRAVLGIFKQTQMLTKALVPDYEKNEEKQSAIYGKMSAISGCGITLGPIIGGHIVEERPESGFESISVIVGFCFILNAGLVYFLPKPARTSKKKSSNQVSMSKNLISALCNSLKQSVIELYKVEWSIYWDVFLFKALVGFAMGVYYSNYALYLKTQFELSPKYVGYVISFQGVIGSVASFFMGHINSFYHSDKDYTQRNFHVFLFMTVSFLGLVISVNIYMYIVWLIPLAMGNAVGRLVTLEMVLKRSCGEHRGTLIGASNSVRSLSGVIAPMVAGIIGQFFGVSYVIYASLFSTTLGVIISYYYRSIRVKID